MIGSAKATTTLTNTAHTRSSRVAPQQDYWLVPAAGGCGHRDWDAHELAHDAPIVGLGGRHARLRRTERWRGIGVQKRREGNGSPDARVQPDDFGP